jgi:hypothetical protein
VVPPPLSFQKIEGSDQLPFSSQEKGSTDHPPILVDLIGLPPEGGWGMSYEDHIFCSSRWFLSYHLQLQGENQILAKNEFVL